MLGNLLFYVSFAVALYIGFLYFRDLGDVTQMLLKVKRADTIRFIRNEYKILAVGICALGLMLIAHFGLNAGPAWFLWVSLALMALFYIFPWVWVHIGLRNQQNSAQYYSIEDAQAELAPASPVIVFENNGIARAHPDSQLMRPHLAGNSEGLDGENVIMTYCAMANLGLGYIPEIQGNHCALEVLAQHGNNLILRDNNTNEPIQQVYGRAEAAGPDGPTMQPWPTFRMTFRTFQKAYPNGTVFLNKPSSNPLLRLFDLVTETVFSAGIARQHNEAKPIMDNMSHSDNRLPAKTYVWGIDVGEDAVCYTHDFLIEQNNLINTEIGGRSIVLVWDPVYESIGAWYNDTGAPITQIDFLGSSDQGNLSRVERLKAGMFWHVWSEFYPQTDINRATQQAKAA
ncbi:MAG: DUF3179 domain-containing (seleno)protein [Halopseudomonas sp.]